MDLDLSDLILNGEVAWLSTSEMTATAEAAAIVAGTSCHLLEQPRNEPLVRPGLNPEVLGAGGGPGHGPPRLSRTAQLPAGHPAGPALASAFPPLRWTLLTRWPCRPRCSSFLQNVCGGPSDVMSSRTRQTRANERQTGCRLEYNRCIV